MTSYYVESGSGSQLISSHLEYSPVKVSEPPQNTTNLADGVWLIKTEVKPTIVTRICEKLGDVEEVKLIAKYAAAHAEITQALGALPRTQKVEPMSVTFPGHSLTSLTQVILDTLIEFERAKSTEKLSDNVTKVS